MYNIDYNSVTSIKEHLSLFGFTIQKKWGQNFIINDSIRKSLIKHLGYIHDSKIWEVGSGLGAMTDLLQANKANLTLVEIDAGFVKFLSEQFANKKNIKIVKGDVLKTWKTELLENGMPKILFGCLPYNISISLLLAFFMNIIIFDKVLITVQKEVGDKILAKEGSKQYCPLSVFSSFFYDAKCVEKIPPSCFWPQPSITSSTILLLRKDVSACKDKKLFVDLVSALFSARRRTIKNNFLLFLKKHYKDSFFNVDKMLSLSGIDPLVRAEQLSTASFLKISNMIAFDDK